MRYLPILVALLFASPALAACQWSTVWPACTVQYSGGDNLEDFRDEHPYISQTNLPTCDATTYGKTVYINDGLDGSCGVSVGTDEVQCVCTATGWDAVNAATFEQLQVVGDLGFGAGQVPSGSLVMPKSGGTFTGDAGWADGISALFGTDSDWSIYYDETGDDQLVLSTPNTQAVASTDAMFQVLVDSATALGANMLAQQKVFEIAKGTLASHTLLFEVSEAGDAQVAQDLAVGRDATITRDLNVLGSGTVGYLDVGYRLDLGFRPTIPADATPNIKDLGAYVLANFSGTISGFDYGVDAIPEGAFVIVESGGGFAQTYDCNAGGSTQLVCANDFDTIAKDSTAWVYGGSSVGWNLVWTSTLGRRRECQQTFTTEQAGDILMCGKALSEIHVINLTCMALGTVPVAQNVEIVDCDANGASCVDSNFEITADAIETNYVDTAGTSFTFAEGSWWGIKLNSFTTLADFLHCQVEYLQF